MLFVTQHLQRPQEKKVFRGLRPVKNDLEPHSHNKIF